ncbi:MAG: type II toxin-antitoxin system VapC family toxin [Candidatus Limnocylindrales bacterium]
MSLALFTRHARVGIDSNVFIYLLDGSAPWADRAAELLDAIADGQGEGVLATLAIGEICSGPAAATEPALVERYADELRSLENVRLVPLTADLAVDAAVLRGNGSLSLADAIHLASARHAGATAFITNDRRIRSTARLEVVYLDELH